MYLRLPNSSQPIMNSTNQHMRLRWPGVEQIKIPCYRDYAGELGGLKEIRNIHKITQCWSGLDGPTVINRSTHRFHRQHTNTFYEDFNVDTLRTYSFKAVLAIFTHESETEWHYCAVRVRRWTSAELSESHSTQRSRSVECTWLNKAHLFCPYCKLFGWCFNSQ